MPERITVRDIEIAVARHFNYRMNLIVPNVSWGLLPWGHEVDVLVVRPSGWAEEVEIKITASDIKADTQKRHRQIKLIGEHDFLYEQLHKIWFAVPEKLAGHLDIPNYAGILTYNPTATAESQILKTVRGPALNKNARKLTSGEIYTVAHLGCMRIWSLKEALNRSRRVD